MKKSFNQNLIKAFILLELTNQAAEMREVIKMKLVIAEKPSVAKSIAKVIGAKSYKNGYYEGNNYKVSWCYGHLVQLAAPNEYDEKYQKWKIADLPIMPEKYKYNVAQGTAKNQFMVLKKLLNDKLIDSVVNACDAGREGESIFRLVYMKSQSKKPIERLWTSSLEDSAIKDGFKHLQPGEKYENLNKAAQARNIADWLVGMNLSRLYTCLYNDKFSVGRVQTPTLAMIAQRDIGIKNFKKEKYYTVKLDLAEFSMDSSKINTYDEAVQLAEGIKQLGVITLTSVEEKQKITKPDKLYDLTTLQREANKKYGFSAQKTLDCLQSLYEKKLTTYPRTDSRYLTDDMHETAKKLLFALDSNYQLDQQNFSSIFDSSKVSDHYAVIPTLSSISADFSKLEVSDDEAKIYELVKLKLLGACSANLIENVTTAKYQYDNYEFTATGKVLVQSGFTEYSNSRNNKVKGNAENALPKLSKTEEYSVENAKAEEKFTQPKKHYTEDTLLKAMETAGISAYDKNIEVERKGLGTPATRAGIIETLIKRELVKRDKKQLICTDKGFRLVTVVADKFKSAELTAEWENQLARIAKGEFSYKQFLADISGEITELVDKYQDTLSE